MLELKNIRKDYPAGDGVVPALKGVNLQFRESEFVSILGPSDCGKTTLLNIIGGLDQHTEGDLVISGRSAKDFKDRDWDAYRNHSVGFIFQNYNLIPHQTVLQNVELALSLSGVSKADRKRRAEKALEEVGLGSQLDKKPAELSESQMQRAAIARSLVNNPDIILADEPTGALDAKTGVQVMNILKEVARERLVVMVTQNRELAEKYSTRIIRMLDGNILSDSSPLTVDEVSRERITEKIKAEAVKKEKKPAMSVGTSFGLSLKNLLAKKARTVLKLFAGSIGISGIALILAVSQGMTDYMNTVQEDTLYSVTAVINAFTYVRIALVGISLVVSLIMMGVLTFLSVKERTKEIGILRAIGASKKNVSSIIHAETVSIGFASGILGVGIAYLLCMPMNAVFRHLTGIGNLTASLPFPAAAALVCISVLLTLFFGIIPCRSAAKKNPVAALRSE